MASLNLNTVGMSGGSDPIRLERIVARLPAVSAVRSDRTKGLTHVEYDPGVVSIERIVSALQEQGCVRVETGSPPSSDASPVGGLEYALARRQGRDSRHWSSSRASVSRWNHFPLSRGSRRRQ
jgi:copper chaperone CopZ